MRTLICGLDGLLRRAYGLFELAESPACVLRLRLRRASHGVDLAGLQLPAQTPVVEIHLWNERVPPMPPAGPDLAWAVKMQRMLVASLRLLAERVLSDPRLAGVQAVTGVTALFFPGDDTAGEKLMTHLGFTVRLYRSPLGRFGEFWENLYTWWIMWAYNPASLHGRRLLRLRRSEIWMSIAELLRRYGAGRTRA